MGSVGSAGHNFLTFEKLPLEKGNKLYKYKVVNHDLFDEIGIIHWRGGWRKYVFTAINHYDEAVVEIDGKKYVLLENIIDIDMSVECHEKINEFIRKLMDEWKKSKKKEVKPNSSHN